MKPVQGAEDFVLSTYAWDNNRNLLTRAAYSCAWDYDDRLVGFSGPSLGA